MQYKLIREIYDRAPGSNIRTSTFQADSDLEALAKVISHCWDFCEVEETMDNFKENDSSLEDVVSMMYSNNGDGQDYIMLVQNMDTGEVLLEDGDYEETEEEDW